LQVRGPLGRQFDVWRNRQLSGGFNLAEIAIRLADLEADRELLVRLLLQYLTPRSNLQRFEWLYLRNPHGPAQAWIAVDSASESVIGSGSIIPRHVYVDGSLRTAAVMADFWIHPDFRSLGPAIKLQRACVQGAEAAGFAFFDLPQGNMPAVYQRMKLLGRQKVVALSKPVCSEAYIRKVVRSRILSRAIALPADLGLRYIDHFRHARSGCDIAIHRGEPGTEFTCLAEEMGNRLGVSVVRSAEYLSWRYYNHYYLKYEFFTAHRNGRLIAYAVVTDTGMYGDVVDFFGESDRRAIADLLLEISRSYRSRGRAGLSIGVHASQSWRDFLLGLGFRERQSRTLVIHEYDRVAVHPPTEPAERWFLTYGDIDY
jgi:hypothetical protein